MMDILMDILIATDIFGHTQALDRLAKRLDPISMWTALF